MPRIITIDKARDAGLTRYFQPQHPCPKGHRAERRVSDYACTACQTEKSRRWKKAHPEKVKEQKDRYYLKHQARLMDEANERYWAKKEAASQVGVCE